MNKHGLNRFATFYPNCQPFIEMKIAKVNFVAHRAILYRSAFADAPFFNISFRPRVMLPSVAQPGLLIFDTFSVRHFNFTITGYSLSPFFSLSLSLILSISSSYLKLYPIFNRVIRNQNKVSATSSS